MSSASPRWPNRRRGTCRRWRFRILRKGRRRTSTKGGLADRNIATELQCRADAASEEHAHWFRRALDAGVKMALGSDIRPLREAALLEMGLWVRDGATAWQTLQAATRNAAELCGAGDQLGTVEVGKIADLVVVAANPLDDINNLRQLQLVIKDGRVVSDKRGA